MTPNDMTGKTENRTHRLGQLWGFLTHPHPSVVDIGERKRAQLLATLTLILMIGYLWALLSDPQSPGEFIAGRRSYPPSPPLRKGGSPYSLRESRSHTYS